MHDLPIGQLLFGGLHYRDAIHVAVAPVETAEALSPGDHIGFLKPGLVANAGTDHIGIVDPSLTQAVEVGQKFYMFLYPQTISSLRHDWTHPAFLPTSPKEVGEAESWLRDFALGYNLDYDHLVNEASSQGYITAHGVDLHGQADFDSNTFWRHLETVTGKTFSQEQRENTSFSCSC